MTGVDGLRQEIAEALREELYDENADEALSELFADAVLPVVTAWAERVARERAAEELRAAAAEIDGDGLGGLSAAYRRIYASDLLRLRAAALVADGRA